MMWPRSGVKMCPEASVNLRNDHLQVCGTQLVDLLRQYCRGVNAMRANLNFPTEITRNQLVGIDGIFQPFGITGYPVEPQGRGHNVIRKSRHLLWIVQPEFA